MFVVIRWPAAGYGPQTLPQDARAEVWRCDAASFENGALVLTNAVLQPQGNPNDPIPTLIHVPWQGTSIEIRRSA